MTDTDTNQQNNLGLPPVEAPDWTISELYNQAWQLVKKYKVLWVFGMAVAGLTGGFSYSQSSNFNSKDLNGIEKIFNTPSSPDKISQVLGTSTASPLLDLIKNSLSNIPIYFWLILGIEILLLIVLGIIVSQINIAWSNASLVQSIQIALSNTKPTIRESSEKAFSSIRPLIWLQIIPSLVLTLVSFLIFGVLVAGIAFGGSLQFVFILLLTVAIVVFIYAIIRLTLGMIWALRIVVLDKKNARESLSLGLRIAKNKFWSMLLLGLVNVILSSIITAVPIMLIGGFLVGGFLSFESNQSVGFVLMGVGAIFLLMFIFGYLLLAGILTAFKASVWTLAYHKIKGKYDSK